MYKNFLNWWNTPTENLMSKGQNILFLVFVLLPIALVLLLIICKIFGLIGWSWLWIILPMISLPLYAIVIAIIASVSKDKRT